MARAGGSRVGGGKDGKVSTTMASNPLHCEGKTNSIDIELSSNGSRTTSDQIDIQEDRDRVRSSASYTDASDEHEHERDSHLFNGARGSSLHGAHQ